MADITDLLVRADRGDTSAVDELMPLVYARLRELAHHQLGAEARARTIDTTTLVRELYLDLLHSTSLPTAARGTY
jgi:hypothetical protein